MKIWHVLLIFAALVHWNQGLDPVPILESKSTKVLLADAYAVTGLREIEIVLNLPGFDFQGKELKPENCSEFATFQWIQACTYANELYEVYNGILSELSNIVEIDNDLTETKRSKRDTEEVDGAWPGLGKFKQWLSGVALLKDVNVVIDRANDISRQLNIHREAAKSQYFFINQNFEQIRKFGQQLNTALQNLTRAVNEIHGKLFDDEKLSNYIARRTNINLLTQAQIQILQTHLFTLRSLFDSCHEHRLSHIAVPLQKFKQILQEESRKLEKEKLRLITSKTTYYYKLNTTNCAISNNTLHITVKLPIVEQEANENILKVYPVKFIYDTKTCQLFKKELTVASDGTKFSIVDEKTAFGHPETFLLERHNGDQNLGPCLESLLRRDTTPDLVKLCPLHCESLTTTFVELVEGGRFSILNPSTDYNVVCEGKVKHKLPKLYAGRYEMDIPCFCNVQEENNGDNILIRETPCNENRSRTQVILNKKWANADFTPEDLFYEEPQKLQDIKIDEAELLIVTPAPPPSGSFLEDLPHRTVTGINFSWLTGLTTMLTLLGIHYILWKFNLYKPLWKGLTCLVSSLPACFSLCCTKTVQEESEETADDGNGKRGNATQQRRSRTRNMRRKPTKARKTKPSRRTTDTTRINDATYDNPLFAAKNYLNDIAKLTERNHLEQTEDDETGNETT